MPSFSKKYNIKINNKNSIIEDLSFCADIKKEKESKVAKLYFVNKNINLNKISNFKDINDYAIITSDDLKKEVKLNNGNVYTASLTDILTASKLLYIFGYEVLFSIKKTIYKYSYNTIIFYIQYIEDYGYYLTFDENLDEESINIVINLLKTKLNFVFDSNIYYEIEDDAFKNCR